MARKLPSCITGHRIGNSARGRSLTSRNRSVSRTPTRNRCTKTALMTMTRTARPTRITSPAWRGCRVMSWIQVQSAVRAGRHVGAQLYAGDEVDGERDVVDGSGPARAVQREVVTDAAAGEGVVARSRVTAGEASDPLPPGRTRLVGGHLGG